jgi:hypothetical protein
MSCQNDRKWWIFKDLMSGGHGLWNFISALALRDKIISTKNLRQGRDLKQVIYQSKYTIMLFALWRLNFNLSFLIVRWMVELSHASSVVTDKYGALM